MTLNQLRVFLSIVDTGAVTRSAEALSLSQPAVTRNLKLLEEALGVELFERLPRSMRLTRYGRSFVRHARAVFVQLEDADAELRHLAERDEDEIVIGAGPGWLMGNLPGIAGKMSRRFPHVAIKVRGGYDEQLIHMLRSGEVEFILNELSSDPALSDLTQEPLTEAPYVVACRHDHPLAGESRVPLARLLEFPWAMPDQAVTGQRRLDGVFNSQNLVPPTALLKSTSVEFILRLLETSDALSLMVASFLGANGRDTVVAVDLDEPLPSRQAGLVTRKSGWASPVTQAFMDELREHCAAHPFQ